MPDDPSPQPHSLLRRRAEALHAWNREYNIYDRVLPIAFLAGIIIALGYLAFIAPPRDFATPAVIKIRSDETLAQIAGQLEAAHAIRSALVFEFLVRALGGNRSVKEGSYFFPTPQDAIEVAIRFREGDFELTPVRVSTTEDMTARDIAALLAKKIAPFDARGFLSAASSSEGFLYPDTYFFYPNQDPEEIVRAMKTDFENHVESASTTIAKSRRPLHDLVTMASILVGEARTDHDRRVVSGILWKRLSIGMPLQVDAPFGYVLDKPLTELAPSDLKIDSPYNTYLNKGLPPTPIGNPSLEAILAAAEPIKSPYLYYLSDKSGAMHYSATFAEHKAQINQYLR